MEALGGNNSLDTNSNIFFDVENESGLEVIEPCDHKESHEDKPDRLTKIVTQFHDYLEERRTHFIGPPGNQNCNDYVALSPLLKFLLNNIGDPFTITSTGHSMHSKKFEIGVLDWFAKLWNIEKDAYWGYITNGGTEGNLHGIFLGRELLPNGILYSSKESHYSILKIARMYRMDFVYVASLKSGEMDCNDLKSKLILNKDRPAIINLNIGTTFKGAVDDLDLVLWTLEKCGFSEDRFYIHCDAALSGIIVPFIDQQYTFKKPIGSMTVSGHKFFGCPMPYGIQMTRKKYRNILSNNIEYIGSFDTTISGSRNGHTPIFLWYRLNMKGRKGLHQDVEICIENARYLRDRLKQAGISAMLNEMSIVVVFERPLDQEIVRKWQLQCEGNLAHIVVMPHVVKEILNDFLDDLIKERNIWYGSGKVQPRCLAEEIGISNCVCSVHEGGIVLPRCLAEEIGISNRACSVHEGRKVLPHCLAEEIGIYNCGCSVHG